MFQDWIGNDYTLNFHAGTDIYPAMVTLVTPGFSAIAIDGSRNFQQLALQGLYSLLGPVNYGSFSTLPLWYDASSRAINALAGDGYIPGSPLFCAGHSYGGSVALITAARIRLASANSYIRYITYGCPKPGDERLADLISRCAGTSIANVGDLVTVVPFTFLQISTVVPTIPLAYALLSSSWHQPPESALQLEDGTLQLRLSQPIESAQIIALVQSAFMGVPIAPLQSHPITEYIRRILLRCDVVAWPINEEVLVDCQTCYPVAYGWLDLGGPIPPVNLSIELASLAPDAAERARPSAIVLTSKALADSGKRATGSILLASKATAYGPACGDGYHWPIGDTIVFSTTGPVNPGYYRVPTMVAGTLYHLKLLGNSSGTTVFIQVLSGPCINFDGVASLTSVGDCFQFTPLLNDAALNFIVGNAGNWTIVLDTGTC
jgi:lipase (class 3)